MTTPVASRQPDCGTAVLEGTGLKDPIESSETAILPSGFVCLCTEYFDLRTWLTSTVHISHSLSGSKLNKQGRQAEVEKVNEPARWVHSLRPKQSA